MKTETRTMVMVIVAILAVIIILMVYRMAHGAEIDAALMNVPATISTLLRC